MGYGAWPGREAARSGWSSAEAVNRPTEDSAFQRMLLPGWVAALLFEADALEMARRADAGLNKLCSTCGEFKEMAAFSPDRRNHDGRHSYCKSCRAKADKVARLESAGLRRVG